MTEWIIPCNPKAYDVVGAFEKFDVLNWKQSVNIEISDIIYIYVGRPYSSILYKCIASNIDLPEVLIDDSEFEVDSSNYSDYGRYMELKKITRYDKDLLKYNDVKHHGLKSVQGPSKMTEELKCYISNATSSEDKLEIDILSSVEGEELTGEEREALIKTRIGQSKFKELLVDKYHVCSLCGIDFEPLLIASHIKPWSKSDGKEKVDINNGLLLCPHHDQLFDKGYISFDDKGNIMVSSLLSEHTRVLMNIDIGKKIVIENTMLQYIRWHRENVFLYS